MKMKLPTFQKSKKTACFTVEPEITRKLSNQIMRWDILLVTCILFCFILPIRWKCKGTERGKGEFAGEFEKMSLVSQ